MTLIRRLMTGAGVLALSTGFAAAAPAVVQNDVNLHAGPGIQTRVVAAMPTGAAVDVMGCRARWCQVAYGGAIGWASRASLGLGGPVAARPGYETYGAGYTYGGYGPGFGYGGTLGAGGPGTVTNERRVGAATSVRGERRGGRAATTGSAQTESQKATEIGGANPMKIEKNQAPIRNAAAPSEIKGANPMQVGSGNAAQRGTAQAGGTRRNARTTTGAAAPESRY